MKPLKLKIQGLNSFTEEQEVDFSLLPERGIFGIFGPTGSGKTTILDAITLSLYGKIARFKKDVQSSYINSECEKAYVCFEFALSASDGEWNYIAEREYKRASKSKRQFECTYCRLTKKNEQQTIVLAERKEKEVTDAIVELFGLEYNDFMRAVIIPQGKFSEFLLLENQDRKNMLERIFNLYEYGKELNEKVRAELRKQEGLCEKLKERLYAFEGFTKESLDLHIEELEKINADTLEMAEKQRAAESVYNQYLEHNKNHQLLLEHEKDFEKLEAIRPQVEEKSKKVMMAEKARYAASLILEVKEWERLLREAADNLSKAKTEKSHRALSLGQNLEKYENWTKRKDVRLPAIYEESEKLKTALMKLNSILIRERELDLDAKNCQKLMKELEGKNLDFAKLNESHVSYSNKIETLRQRKASLSNSLENLELVRQGALLSKDYYEKIAALKNDTELIKAVNNKLLIEKKNYIEAVEREKEIDSELANLELKAKELEKKKEEARLYEVSFKEAQKQNMAFALSAFIEKDMPCPVCGSTHHPCLAENNSNYDMDDIEKKLKAIYHEIEEYNKKISDENMQILRKKSEVDSLKSLSLQRIKDLEEEIKRLTEDFEQKKQRASSVIEELKVLAERTKTELTDDAFHKKLEGLLRVQAEFKEIDENIEKLRLVIENIEKEREVLKNEINTFSTNIRIIKETGRVKRESIKSEKLEIEKLSSDPEAGLKVLTAEKEAIISQEQVLKLENDSLVSSINELEKQIAGLEEKNRIFEGKYRDVKESLRLEMEEKGFSEIQDILNSVLEKEVIADVEKEIKAYNERVLTTKSHITRLIETLNRVERNEILDMLLKSREEHESLKIKLLTLAKNSAVILEKIEETKKKLALSETVEGELKKSEKRLSLLKVIETTLRGGDFVEFVAKRNLSYIAREASGRLLSITHGRYEIDLDDADFVIRDRFSGGKLRYPQSLSGGEVFIVSLCLALALSARIQLKNSSSLDFFFLDEGFGALDDNALDAVIKSLTSLKDERMLVGVISHVDKIMREIPSQILVNYSDLVENGSRISIK